MVPFRPVSPRLAPFDPIWLSLAPLGPVWPCLACVTLIGNFSILISMNFKVPIRLGGQLILAKQCFKAKAGLWIVEVFTELDTLLCHQTRLGLFL